MGKLGDATNDEGINALGAPGEWGRTSHGNEEAAAYKECIW